MTLIQDILLLEVSCKVMETDSSIRVLIMGAIFLGLLLVLLLLIITDAIIIGEQSDLSLRRWVGKDPTYCSACLYIVMYLSIHALAVYSDVSIHPCTGCI